MKLTVNAPQEARKLLDSNPEFALWLTDNDGRELMEVVEQEGEVDSAGLSLFVQARIAGPRDYEPYANILLPNLNGVVAVTGGEDLLEFMVQGQPVLAVDSTEWLQADRSVRQLVILGDTGAPAETLREFASLRRLDLLECGEGVEVLLESIRDLRHLRELSVWRKDSFRDVKPLGNLTGLTKLVLHGCKELSSLEPLAKLTGITTLIISLMGRTGWQLRDSSGLRGVTTLGPLAGLTGLTRLGLLWFKGVASLGPLEGLTGLVDLDLTFCEGVTSLEPLAGLTALTSLDLTGCERVTDLEPLAGLKALTSLNLSYCEGVTDLGPLAGLTALTSLDLTRCRRVTSLEPLAGLKELETLKLNGCSSIRNVRSLETHTSLRILEYNIQPPEAMAILLRSALQRGDARSIGIYLPAGLAQVEVAQDIGYFSRSLSLAIRSFPDEPGASDSMGELVQRVRRRGDLDQDGWRAILADAVALGDPGMRSPMESLVDDLSAKEGRVLLSAWLEALARVPESAGAWAMDLVDRILRQWEDTPQAAEISASAALFYARMGRDGDVSSWLERATRAGQGTWRDRLNLALLDVDLERGEFQQARRRVDLLVGAPARDDGLARYARALADILPEEAGVVLEQVSGSPLRKQTATDLAKRGAFAALPDKAIRLLLLLQENDGGLPTFLGRLANTHPKSPVVREFLRQAGPGASEAPAGPSLESIPKLVNFLGTSRFRRVREALSEAPPANRNLWLQGLVGELRRRRLLDREEAEELLGTLLPHEETGDHP